MRDIPTEELLSRLNESQRQAVVHGDEPLLIVAGAGSGKTTTLVHRVAHLIARGVPAHRILLLTFTRRAAGEMLRRVEALLHENELGKRIWGGTFHAVGTRLLRMYGAAIGVNPRFTIHDRDDSESLLGTVLAEQKLDSVSKSRLKQFPKKSTCEAIYSYSVNSREKLENVLAGQFAEYEPFAEPLKKLFDAYAERKQSLGVMDYDDLLLRWCDLLAHEQAGPRIRERFDYILVDEYQDTNRLQSDLLQRLCPKGALAAVGDDAQSIYSFRAATVRNILDFPKQFPGTRVVKLEQNYRSTQPLLDASNRVIAASDERFEKELWSERKEGLQPQLIDCYDEDEQAEFLLQRIKAHQAAGVPLRQQAVLFRASHHSIALEAGLARKHIAFVKYGGLKFVEAAHVKDLLSFLRWAENPRDIVAAVRVLTLLSGIGEKKARDFATRAVEYGGFAFLATVKPPAKAKEDWPALVKLVGDLTLEKPLATAEQIRRTLAFYEPFLHDKYDNPKQRLLDLQQLELIADKFEDRTTMLADLTIDPPSSTADLPQSQQEQNKDQDYLVLSTLHSAKGLEWQVVYVMNAADGMIPSEYSFLDRAKLEEERRMFYVALTRAADRLYVCYPKQRTFRGGWHNWDDDGRRDLTRFLTPSVLKTFVRQDARRFDEARAAAAPVKPGKAKKPAKRMQAT